MSFVVVWSIFKNSHATPPATTATTPSRTPMISTPSTSLLMMFTTVSPLWQQSLWETVIAPRATVIYDCNCEISQRINIKGKSQLLSLPNTITALLTSSNGHRYLATKHRIFSENLILGIAKFNLTIPTSSITCLLQPFITEREYLCL